MPRASVVLVALTAVLVVAASAAVGGPLAAPAEAATAPTIVVQRLDPLQTAPVSLLVAAVGADGELAAFTGSVTLTVGRTRASATVSSPGDASAVLRIDTTTLSGGLATLRARLRVAGRTQTLDLPFFAEILPALAVRAFGCAAVPPGGGTIRWAVARMAGAPVRTPNSREVDLLPYVPSSTRRTLMTGPDGLPLTTSGTVTILSGATASAANAAGIGSGGGSTAGAGTGGTSTGGTSVAVRRLPAQVRRLVFGVAWDGRVGGTFRPGIYTARLTLKDAKGSTTTAEQQVVVGPASASPCRG